MKSKFFIFFIALLINLGTSVNGASSKPIIPAIAAFPWGKVGSADTFQIERYLGAGTPFTGVHPKSARRWKCKCHHVLFYADGFDFNNNGRGYIIDHFRIERDIDDSAHRTIAPISTTNICPCKLLGTVRIGMRRMNVLNLLHKKHIATEGSQDHLSITCKGYKQVNETTSYNTWKSLLQFHNHILNSIEVYCN